MRGNKKSSLDHVSFFAGADVAAKSDVSSEIKHELYGLKSLFNVLSRLQSIVHRLKEAIHVPNMAVNEWNMMEVVVCDS